jgi:hypothetical protein
VRWLDRLERHLGFLAIPNLIVAVIIGQALMTLAAMQQPHLPLQLMLDPVAVASGQWYRLLTWVIVPSTGTLGVFLAIFWFWLLWMMGQALEREWGAFRCTLYLLLGIALPGLGSMLLWYYFGITVLQTGFYFSTSLMLAFAAIAPEFTLYLFFVLPVKMRWMAWALGAWLLLQALGGGWAGGLAVLFGVGNYLIFFLPQAVGASRQRAQVAANRQAFTQALQQADTHRCHDCGAGRGSGLRLCTCERCGDEGRFWCEEHLPLHLSPLPQKSGTSSAQKKKKKG